MVRSRSDRSADRGARRSHRPRSRSPLVSRSRTSSHRRSSKRRSPSRSRERERSRRAHRHSHSHRRHRSRSRERHKHRRRGSDDKRDRHRSRSRSRPRSTSKAKEKRQEEEMEEKTPPASSSQDSKAGKEQDEAAVEKGKPQTVESGGDMAMQDVEKHQSTPVEVKVDVVGQESKDQEATEAVEETSNAVGVESVEKQELQTAGEKAAAQSKPALDVSSIKKDILKALADARSTIAVIKKNGTATSVTTSPALSSAAAKVEKEEQEQEQEKPLKSPEKKVEMAKFPQKTMASPRKTVPPAAAAAASADDFDMFSMAALDDHDDAMNGGAGVAAITVNEVSLQSNCDDAEGYYSTTIGEVLDGKYRVLGTVGKGVFSTVLRCQCITPLKTAGGGSLNVVAVKLIRNNDIMRDAAQTELKLLNELGERDPRDKKHCIRLLDSFTHRNHVAMAFEPMQMNVREAMKKFGGKGGISIQAVRVFSKHLLIALNHLESCGVIHADIKPDNILLDEKQTTIKLCDFGSAFKMDDGKQDPTPYLVSRFYRAPEIVLGLAYDKAVDMWSVGCCLYEMFTGKVMFPGSTNNEMLKFFMELKGKIPNKLIKKHRQAYIDQFEMEPHFTEDLKFCSRESDRVTGKPILRLMETIKPKNDLASSLMAAKSATDDRKQVLELRSLLDRMFTLDPSKRISVRDALAHPFVKG
ncbi:Serine/threonine-protein kinase [Phytophthora fragariae]|uniref:non-specific serine/threonine protein kinase n=1 Tax=Phytophthora fragariae TaxID=53985 RepID=A0A6A3MJT8_9STRA|nr:Serine/threonine-protein kinase [Phytophthora fragariae]